MILKKILSAFLSINFILINLSYAKASNLEEDDLIKILTKKEVATKNNTSTSPVKISTKKDVKIEKSAVKRAVIADFEDLNKPYFTIRLKNNLTTKNFDLQEGKYIDFETVSESSYNGKIYPAGTAVKGRIETITQNSPMGGPAEIIVDNFVVAEKIKAHRMIKKSGANRAYWVYPLVIVCIPGLGLGILCSFIRGGHAKISKNNEFKIYITEN